MKKLVFFGVRKLLIMTDGIKKIRIYEKIHFTIHNFVVWTGFWRSTKLKWHDVKEAISLGSKRINHCCFFPGSD
jgi:hypothetical protein